MTIERFAAVFDLDDRGRGSLRNHMQIALQHRPPRGLQGVVVVVPMRAVTGVLPDVGKGDRHGLKPLARRRKPRPKCCRKNGGVIRGHQTPNEQPTRLPSETSLPPETR